MQNPTSRATSHVLLLPHALHTRLLSLVVGLSGLIHAHILRAFTRAFLERRARTLKVRAMALGTEQGDDEEESRDAADEDALDGRVVRDLHAFAVLVRDPGLDVVAAGGLDLRRGGGDHVSELVGHTGEGGTERRRGDLGEEDGDDAPRALDAELDEERAGGEPAERFGDDPERDEAPDPEHAEDDGESTADILRRKAGDGTTGDGAAVADDGGDRGGVRGEELGRGEVFRVQVLRAVRKEVEAYRGMGLEWDEHKTNKLSHPS
jgi:hypothetical protein